MEDAASPRGSGGEPAGGKPRRHFSGAKLLYSSLKKKFSVLPDERKSYPNTGVFSSWGWRFSSPEAPLARSDGFCGGIYIAIRLLSHLDKRHFFIVGILHVVRF